ncbi:MAG: NAD(P)/FAD-dependent oxidoreductase [Saprospiraceae bacterium]
MPFNISDTDQKRVVIIGGGFAGLTLARKLARHDFQIVLIDKNNYHQFQPLFYQVAMAGLEPSSIVFPFRKLFQNNRNVTVRMAEVELIDAATQEIHTSIGPLRYDYLVLATGADTNWYGNERIRTHAIPMKSVSEALFIRNNIFEDYERAATATDYTQRQPYLDIVVVGGGATGVEVAGSLAEMKKHIIGKDYAELNREEIDIHLIHGEDRLLSAMSPQASAKAEKYLLDLGVKLQLNTFVTDYDGQTVTMSNGATLQTNKVIWAAGITGNVLPGLPEHSYVRGGRIQTDAFNRVADVNNVFVLGDLAHITDDKFPKGYPQVAQVAIQQAKRLSANLIALEKGRPLKPFQYTDLGSMATVGRNRAVVDLPFWRFQGAFAWFVWLFVHLFAILGAKNKVFIFINWVWNYFTYDQSLRLVIKPWKKQF